MDDITGPNLKAEEERKSHRARRLERQARRKIRAEMAAAAVAAAAEYAREEAGRVDETVAETYEDAKPSRRGDDRAGDRRGGNAEEFLEDDGEPVAVAPPPSKKKRPKKKAQPAPAQSIQALAKVEPTQIARALKPGALAETVPDDAFEIARMQRAARMKEIRSELRRRRRLRSLGILIRFLIFVIGPTAFVGWYYYEKATDMFVSESALIFKNGASQMPGAGGLLGSFGGFGSITESVSVQEYIQSRDILERLEAEHGLITHFQDPSIDEYHRLKADALFDDAFKYYKGEFLRSGKVSVSYDAAEGIMRLEVVAATPEAAQRFSKAIISYSEELVNSLNERSRNDGVRSAEAKVAAARDDLLDAQRSVSEVQEQLNIFSVESEAGALQSRILATETVLADVDSQIAKLETVAKDPNDSRFVPLRLERQLKIEELANLRSRLTGGDGAQGPSMARLGADLELARVEQATANLMYTSALNSLETAIATAEAQSTYLETVVQPSKPTKASKPERLQNTGLVFLICFAVYILGLLTISLIREQAAI